MTGLFAVRENPSAVVLFKVPDQRWGKFTPSRGHASPSETIFVPGRGAKTETGLPAEQAKDREPLTTEKNPKLDTIVTSGANEEKSRRWKTFPIVWSSRTPVAPTIAIFGSEMSKRFNAKWNAFERSFVSCSVILTSLSPSDSIVSGDRESQSPTTKSGLRPSSSILDRAPSQQTA